MSPIVAITERHVSFKVDGCENYTVLNKTDHDQGYELTSYPGCDKSLVTGWYRFQGAAGDRITDKCIPKGHCSAEYLGLLNGSHPTVTEGAVIHNVCFTGNNSCCFWRNLTEVKNCSSYYVYQLHKNS